MSRLVHLKTITDITRHIDMLRHLSESVPPIADLFTSGVLA